MPHASLVAAAMLAAMGQPVVVGSTTTTGRRRIAQVTVPDGFGGSVQVRRITIAVAAGSLGELAQDTALSWNGVAYLVRAQAPSDDGGLDLIEVVPVGGG